MTTTDEQFVASLVAFREANGWSQHRLGTYLRDAGLTHFCQTIVSRVERGERLVRLNEAIAIAAALGFTLDQMTADSGVGRLASAAAVIRGAITQATNARLALDAATNTQRDAVARLREIVNGYSDEILDSLPDELRKAMEALLAPKATP